MSEFPSAKYDKWLTTTPQDRAHVPGCACDTCHQCHVDQGRMVDQALDAPQDFACCVDDFESRIIRKVACRTHPRSYSEDGSCEECVGS